MSLLPFLGFRNFPFRRSQSVNAMLFFGCCMGTTIIFTSSRTVLPANMKIGIYTQHTLESHRPKLNYLYMCCTNRKNHTHNRALLRMRFQHSCKEYTRLLAHPPILVTPSSFTCLHALHLMTFVPVYELGYIQLGLTIFLLCSPQNIKGYVN